MQDADGAIADLQAALEIAPDAKDVKAELTKFKRQQQAAEAKLKGTFKKMFG